MTRTRWAEVSRWKRRLLAVILWLICGAIVLWGWVITIGCLNDSTTVYICKSNTASGWYTRLLWTALAIATVGIWLGHRRRSPRIITGAWAASCVLAIGTQIWGGTL